MSSLESNRIADYFVVIGCPPDVLEPLPDHEQPLSTNDPVKLAYIAKILDRYPVEDRTDLSLPTGLTLFCLPDGLHVHSSPKSPTFYSFVQTSESGAQLIGCCLTFFEELTAAQRNCFDTLIDKDESTADVSSAAMSHLKLYVPKCLCLLSQWPFVLSFKKYLCHLYRLSLTPCRIPIERYVCNFLDDVPAPPPGLVEVSYFIGTENVVFKRPPSNEPNAWSTMPMTPLFECLSLDHVVDLFCLLLSERQIAFISSQYSLLTSCAESILSLIYPCRWTHVYIPILPRRLLGVLAAPLPFVVGVHTSFLPSHMPPRPVSVSVASGGSSLRTSEYQYRPTCFDGQAVFSSETVRVFLDENRIEQGSLGPPPRLPEGRYRKLMNDLRTMAPAFQMRMPDWKNNQLPFYDSAFEMSVRPDLADGTVHSKDKVDEKGVRGSFLKFMVTILKNYRQYLVYPTPSEPFPLVKFRETEYLRDHPSDWTPILTVLLQSQAFYQFVDVRVSYSGWSDHEIVFFDESIEAKLNRLLFRLHRRDTPFLLDNSFKHAKTYVAPSVDMDGLAEDGEGPVDVEGKAESDGGDVQESTMDKYGLKVYHYHNFPRLNPQLYRKSTTAQLAKTATNPRSRPLTKTSSSRLKRANVLRLTTVPFAEANVSSSSSDPVACIFSTFLIIFSRVVSTGLSPPVVKRAPPTLSQVLDTLNIAHPVTMKQDGIRDSGDGEKWSSPVLGDIELTKTTSSYSIDECEADGTVNDDDDDKRLTGEEGHTTDATQDSILQGDDVEEKVGATSSELKTKNPPANLHREPSSPVVAQRAESHASVTGRSSFSTSAVAPFSQFGENSESMTTVLSQSSASFLDVNKDVREEYLTIARAAIETAFELFEVMHRRGHEADEEVFRSLADACAVCGSGGRVIEVLETMTDQGMLPDVQICNAASRALSFIAGTVVTGDGESIPPGTPKDITEATESRDFRKLRKCLHQQKTNRDSSVGFRNDPGINESIFKWPTNRVSRPTDFKFSSSARSSGPAHRWKAGSLAEKSREEFCAVKTLGGGGRSATTVGTNLATAASPRFATQVTLADRTLDMLFKELIIDLVNPSGTACPNIKCRKQLQIFEIINNFSTDANTYTVKCPYCSKEFVPRFTVFSSNSDWIGSTGGGTSLWCELLSPWVLQKEVLNVIESNGVETIVSSQFRDASLNTQGSVVFWNMMVYFRLHGMPYAFLITEKLSMAFMIPLDDV